MGALESVKRTWVTAVLRARPCPEWIAGKLSPDSQARLRVNDLLSTTCATMRGAVARGRLADSPRAGNALDTRICADVDNLHADEMGLEESMRRFDRGRGKPVAKEESKEHQPVGHDNESSPSKRPATLSVRSHARL